MLTIVLGYKRSKHRAETPEVLYLGHDRNKAKAVTVPEGFTFIETQIIAPGFRRRWAKSEGEPSSNNSQPAPADEASASDAPVGSATSDLTVVTHTEADQSAPPAAGQPNEEPEKQGLLSRLAGRPPKKK